MHILGRIGNQVNAGKNPVREVPKGFETVEKVGKQESPSGRGVF